MFTNGYFGAQYFGDPYWGPAAVTGGGGASGDPPRRWTDWTLLLTSLRSGW